MTDTTGPTIARVQVVAIDCADPAALAAFYSAVLGVAVDHDEDDDDWVQLAPSAGTRCPSLLEINRSRFRSSTD